MSVATERPSLLELAAEAFARQRDEETREARERLARNRLRLLNDAEAAVEAAFGADLALDQLTSARYAVLSTDDLIHDRPDLCVVGVELLGVRFEYRKVSGYDQWGLYHQSTHPECDLCRESYWPITSIAELGRWLAEVATRCSHPDGADDGSN